jgi:hypothetical protein
MVSDLWRKTPATRKVEEILATTTAEPMMPAQIVGQNSMNDLIVRLTFGLGFLA